jgi:1-deoxy-D-xylulose-5-phosphate reductoisomerase
MKNISILGSTGSIGTQTLSIVSQNPHLFIIIGLSAGNNLDLLKKQILQFKPKIATIRSKENYTKLCIWAKEKKIKTELSYGEKGVNEIAKLKQDLIIIAIVGSAGIAPTFIAISNKTTIALACKEALVSAGDIIIKKAKETNTKIIPIDSEHAAIKQCIGIEPTNNVHKITLTASGGPLWNSEREIFNSITPAQALAHPNWDMGGKISIDSATMVNKGLEIIEAHHLFEIDYSKLKVVVHKQSIVHSFVEYIDGNILAHLSPTDMAFPIQYALTYPQKLPSPKKRLSIQEISKLTFEEPNNNKFPLLKTAIECGKLKNSYPIVFNTANELFVNLFLKEKISFLDIEKHILTTIDNFNHINVTTIEDVIEIDKEIKNEIIQNFK